MKITPCGVAEQNLLRVFRSLNLAKPLDHVSVTYLINAVPFIGSGVIITILSCGRGAMRRAAGSDRSPHVIALPRAGNARAREMARLAGTVLNASPSASLALFVPRSDGRR